MQKVIGSSKIEAAYHFLKEAEKQDRLFTLTDLAFASGWSKETTKANLSKKLSQFVVKGKGVYRCEGIDGVTLEAFSRICSQNSRYADDPQRPRFAPKVEGLVIKAQEAALAAVQHYNNPTAKFKSDTFIVLMVIAFTALFHAIFEREKIDYVAYKNDGTPKTVRNENMLWDVEKSATYYNDNLGGKLNKDDLKAMLKNLELLIPIRHNIEHRFNPIIDPTIVGLCQAMLMNFEKILVHEFTTYYALNTSLSIALQFSTERTTETVQALRRLQTAEHEELKEYMRQFCNELPLEILNNPCFAYRVRLVPKLVSREKSSDFTIETVVTDHLTAEEKVELEKYLVAIRLKQVEVSKDPGDTFPYRRTELLKVLSLHLSPSVSVTGHDLDCLNKVYKIKDNPIFYYSGKVKGSPMQYSITYFNWIIQNYEKNPEFFTQTRIQAKTSK